MFRRFSVVAVVSIVWLALTAAAALGDGWEFEAELEPGQEVPLAPDSDGEGEAEFEVKKKKIKFELEWEDLNGSVFAIHIHCAPAGANGPVGVTLFSGSKGTEAEIKGKFRTPDAGNACGWATLGDVVAAMATGNTYVNVHTNAVPSGEIRGQIEAD